jgi:hypothetical protein
MKYVLYVSSCNILTSGDNIQKLIIELYKYLQSLIALQSEESGFLKFLELHWINCQRPTTSNSSKKPVVDPVFELASNDASRSQVISPAVYNKNRKHFHSSLKIYDWKKLLEWGSTGYRTSNNVTPSSRQA